MSWEHPLGTDQNGRDVLSRLLYGTPSALGGVLLALAVAFVIGVPWGLTAGYLGGRIDELLMRVADAVLAFPGIVLAVTITGLLGPGLRNAMIAVGFVFSPSLARLLRSTVIPIRESDYVRAARSFGTSGLRAAMRHVLPNAMAPVLVQLCGLASFCLIIEAGLSFLGLGVQPPDPSWGGDLAHAYQYFISAPFATLAPGLLITVVAFCLTQIGDGLRILLRAE